MTVPASLVDRLAGTGGYAADLTVTEGLAPGEVLEGVELEGCVPMTEWAPEDVRAHIDFQQALNTELLDSGELVDAQGLAGPDVAKVVVSDGVNPPKIIDGPSSHRSNCSGIPRKEVIQPQLPLRLPCYDFTPITDPTFDGSLPCGLGHRLRVLPTFVV